MMYRAFGFAALVALVAADVQRDTLMDLHSATKGERVMEPTLLGDSWTRRDGWGSGDFCTWFGVECDHDPPGTSQITSIALSDNNLEGTIPDSVRNLLSLKVFELNNNNLRGGVPEHLAELPNLQMVHLQYNQLSGPLPAQMMNLTVDYPRMQEIDLSYNMIDGPIPETLFGPTTIGPFAPADSLKVFNLRYNKISGNIPERISRAATIYSILLGGNNMTGVVDNELGPWLASAKYCDLSGNSWSCPLPDGVADHCQAACQ